LDDFVVGRKAIIEFLRVIFDLSPDPRTAWNKILRRRRAYGMDKLFHHDMAGHPYIIKTEMQAWIVKTDGKAQHVRRVFEKKEDKEIVQDESGHSQ
jgi:hypothetical protein